MRKSKKERKTLDSLVKSEKRGFIYFKIGVRNFKQRFNQSGQLFKTKTNQQGLDNTHQKVFLKTFTL